jgi:hypothetical protein
MTHTHDHGHHHSHHGHDSQSSLSFDEKMVKLLEHWIKHNDDHAETYKEWSEKAKDNNLDHACAIILEAAEMTLQINEKFKEALKSLTVQH